ncbi:MAG: hypothetical protein HYU84_02080, partial [Chloroflexi bacterium]|nr:hypothetical protein [Chloroflexota bacterium]
MVESPPPGIISSIKSGFDAIASNITAILLPLLLNLFLWLGPRLQMNALFESAKGDMTALYKAFQIPTEQIKLVMDRYESLSQTVNLFGIMRTLPIGISSLFIPNSGVFTTPLGNPDALQVSGLNFSLWLFLLTLVGWIGGALYFRGVASVALEEKIT